ncbi:MAG: hypothetical protein KFB93_06520 [Simkaniaceae bacterium]|nr:MAG: hypothetical protein KFB93_06520 [Simkaniaceae bacterium]
MKILSRLLFLLYLPAFLLSPIPSVAFHSESQHSTLEFDLPRDALGRVNPWILLQPENLSLDRYFSFIDLTDNETFLNSLTEEEFDLVVNFVTHMVEASVPDSFEDLKELYRLEIDELLEDLYGEPKWTFNDSFEFEYIPAISHQNPDYLLCKNWFKNKAHHFGHWCKKHKKPLIAGAVIVGVITVAVVTGGIGGSSAVAVGGALVNETLNDETSHEEQKSPSKIEPAFPKEEMTPIIINRANEMKEELYHELPDEPLNIPPSEESSFWEKPSETGRTLISQGCHDVYDFIYEQLEPIVEVHDATQNLITTVSPELGEKVAITNTHESFKEHVAQGHEKIDGVLHTDYALLYSDETKAAKGEIITGVLPPPGTIGKTPKGSKSTPLKNELSKTPHHLSLPCEKSIELFKNAGIKLEPYQGKYLPEAKARELIHSTNITTFPRPKGIPENFRVRISNKGAGIVYVHPEHSHTSIRVMPGKPHSPLPHQQKPYIIFRKNGNVFDKYGKIVDAAAPEAHIPLKEFALKDGL